MKAALFTMAGGTAWARVESGKHFPTDVLASAALSHFTSVFLYDAFHGRARADVSCLDPERHGVCVTVTLLF
jgi:membrane-associated phospholipid phosphatase